MIIIRSDAFAFAASHGFGSQPFVELLQFQCAMFQMIVGLPGVVVVAVSFPGDQVFVVLVVRHLVVVVFDTGLEERQPPIENLSDDELVLAQTSFVRRATTTSIVVFHSICFFQSILSRKENTLIRSRLQFEIEYLFIGFTVMREGVGRFRGQ